MTEPAEDLRALLEQLVEEQRATRAELLELREALGRPAPKPAKKRETAPLTPAREAKIRSDVLRKLRGRGVR